MTSGFGHNHQHPLVRNLWTLKDLAIKHGVPDEVNQQIEHCLDIFHTRDDYCDKMSSSASDHVTNLIEQSINHPWKDLFKAGTIPYLAPRMVSGKLEGNFLKTLVSMNNAKKVLEVGLFTGCGALTMAEALPADGSVTTCEIVPYVQNLAREYMDKSPHGKKVTIKGGPALASLEEMAEAGEKLERSSTSFSLMPINLIMDRDMLTVRGTIIVDNSLFMGLIFCKDHPSAEMIQNGLDIHEFNEFVAQDERVYKVVVPIRDGVTMIRRRSDVEGSV